MSKDVSIKICMGTGGIAAGGVEVKAAFEKSLASAGIRAAVEKNCSVHKVGCRGFCARDVLVDVILDGAKTTYQYIKPDMVSRIVSEHIMGGTPVGDWLVKELGIPEGEDTSEDLRFTVETVNCVGACSIAPVIIVNKTVHGKVTTDKLMKEIKVLKEGPKKEYTDYI